MVLAAVPVAKTGILKMDLFTSVTFSGLHSFISLQGCHARLRFSIEKGYRNWYVACHSCKGVVVCPKKNGNCAFQKQIRNECSLVGIFLTTLLLSFNQNLTNHLQTKIKIKFSKTYRFQSDIMSSRSDSDISSNCLIWPDADNGTLKIRFHPHSSALLNQPQHDALGTMSTRDPRRLSEADGM